MKKYDLVKAASLTRPGSERERAKPLLFKIHGDRGKIDRKKLLPRTVLEGSARAPDPTGTGGHSLPRPGRSRELGKPPIPLDSCTAWIPIRPALGEEGRTSVSGVGQG